VKSFALAFLATLIFFPSAHAVSCAADLAKKAVAWNWVRNRPADFESLVSAVRKDLKSHLEFTKKKEAKIQWQGPFIVKQPAVMPFDERLSMQTLKATREKTGRSALEEIVSVFMQVAMEQGRRTLVYSDHFNRADELVRSVRRFVEAEKFEDAMENVYQAKEIVEELNAREEISADAFTTLSPQENGRMNWPTSGRPVSPEELVEKALPAFKAAYGLSVKDSKMAVSEVLRGRLLAAMKLGVQAGRREMLANEPRLTLLVLRFQQLEPALGNSKRVARSVVLPAIAEIIKLVDDIRIDSRG
jgi:hypothetical protein